MTDPEVCDAVTESVWRSCITLKMMICHLAQDTAGLPEGSQCMVAVIPGAGPAVTA